jgi:cell fate regulator YaaT (PSP1 superfamily)
VHFCDPSGFSLAVGDTVIVETENGPRDGRVVMAPDQVAHSDLRGPMDSVIAVVEPE